MKRLPRPAEWTTRPSLPAFIQVPLFEDCTKPVGLDESAALRPMPAPAAPKRRKKGVQAMRVCVWCGEKKSIEYMRHPLSSRGATPSTCHDCREANPTLGWCDYHGGPHDKSMFTPVSTRPIGIYNHCILAESEKASNERNLPPRRCASCLEELTS